MGRGRRGRPGAAATHPRTDEPESTATPWDRALPDLLGALGTSPAGLDAARAAERLAAARRTVGHRPPWLRPLATLGRQFADPLILLLVAAAAISAALGEALDAAIVLAIVGMSALLGGAQTHRSERAVERLAALVHREARVRRGGATLVVPFADVVVGDVVELGPGDLLPGDGRLLEATDLVVDQSVLTGEPFPVRKRASDPPGTGPLVGRDDVLLEGAHVESGEGLAVVVATGEEAELGRLARALSSRTERTAFERGVIRFGRFLTNVALVIAAVTLVVSALVGRPLLDAALFALALAVGLAPELLPAILSVSLASGARRMAERRVIVRRLDAIEDVGGMDVLCMDKTGTLTEGEVVVVGGVDVAGAPSDEPLRLAAIAARLGGRPDDPIDAALLRAAPVDPGAPGSARSHAPFDFRRRRSSVLVDGDGPSGVPTLVVKGAFRAVLERCAVASTVAGDVPIAEVAVRVAAHADDLGRQGRRVLAVATRALPGREVAVADDERELVLVGLVVLADPPKADAAAAIARLTAMGITPVMLTGDARFAAAHVAGEVGMPATPLLVGSDLQALDDDALADAVAEVRVMAELDPLTKERVVRALQHRGHVVGFLGDGINDAAAIRLADVGISVDTATTVAKGAADLVLLEKDLDVLADGVRLGRRTFVNTMTYVLTTVTANLGNVVSIAIATAFLPFFPLLPRQILLLNLLSDLPSLAIAGDRVDEERLTSPQRWDVATLRRATVTFGLVSSAFDLLMFAALLQVFAASEGEFRTAWFVGSVLTELVVLFAFRTRRAVMASRPSNGLIVTSAIVAVGTVGFVAVPALAGPMGFTDPRPAVLGTVVGLTVAYAATSEWLKARLRTAARRADDA